MNLDYKEELLRSAGCNCEKPLLGERPGVGPRCRLCGAIAKENPMDELTDPVYISPFPEPTGLEKELLDQLSEECAEVIQRVCKAMRFGVEETQAGQPYNNGQRIAHEFGNLLEIVNRLRDLPKPTFCPTDIQFGMTEKARKLEKYQQNR